MTLDLAFENYISNRKDLRPSSIIVYTNIYKHAKTEIGSLDIAQIKYSDIKSLYLKLRYDEQLKPRTIELLKFGIPDKLDYREFAP